MSLLLKLRANISRLFLILILICFTYVVTRESYNFAHWMPHKFFRDAGLSYQSILWIEQNTDKPLHLFGGFVITFLLIFSDLRIFKSRNWIPLALVCVLCLSAEVFQYLIGRGKETSDLLLGICGSFMAYLAANRKK